MDPKRHPNFSSILLPLFLSAALLAGCNLPSGTPIPVTAIPSVVTNPTTTVPLNTATSPAATPTPVPSLTPTPEPDKLVFASGATAGVATGNLLPGQTKSLTVSATQNQPLIVILNSPNKDLSLGVLNPDGSTLLDPTKKSNRLLWLLPKTGAYTIQVIGAAAP